MYAYKFSAVYGCWLWIERSSLIYAYTINKQMQHISMFAIVATVINLKLPIPNQSGVIYPILSCLLSLSKYIGGIVWRLLVLIYVVIVVGICLNRYRYHWFLALNRTNEVSVYMMMMTTRLMEKKLQQRKEGEQGNHILSIVPIVNCLKKK